MQPAQECVCVCVFSVHGSRRFCRFYTVSLVLGGQFPVNLSQAGYRETPVTSICAQWEKLEELNFGPDLKDQNLHGNEPEGQWTPNPYDQATSQCELQQNHQPRV